jgi:tRNA nucleotidyltransferase (CCA-adding enzyme)
MKIYQVGGSIRDELLGKRASDRDFVVIGSDEEAFMERFPKAIRVGRRHCVYIVEGEEFTLSPEPDIESDLAQRDLTVNAMARDRQGRLYSLPGSSRDLEERILRPVSLQNFFDDPLRVLRAARLLCCLDGFSAAPSLMEAMRLASAEQRLAGLSAERVGNEFLKAFSCPHPGRFLTLLQKVGALGEWLPEMATAHAIPAGPVEWHRGSLFDHTCTVMERLAGSALSVWMGLCHDLGKSATPAGFAAPPP